MIKKIFSLVLAAAPLTANAAVVSVANNETAFVDGGHIYRDFVVTADMLGTDTTVTDVDLSVRFAKHSGNRFYAEDDLSWSGDGWLNEMEFVLISPTGTTITLINNSGWRGTELVSGEGQYTFQGRVPGFAGEIIFDQSAEYAVDHDTSAPRRGRARPSDRLLGNLDSFLDESAVGTWRLFVEDDQRGDGLSFYAAELTLTTSPSEVPLPAALPMLIAGLGALGVTRARKKS